MKKIVSRSTRRHLKGAVLGYMGFCTSWAVDKHHEGSPEWLEVVDVDLQLKRLGSQFHGLRIVHVSDLHCSRTVSEKYLRHCIDRINQLDADVVVLTGDYVTCDINGRFRKKVSKLVGQLNSRLGIYACLGNHDYGVDGVFRPSRKDFMHQMIESMESNGINVLRNQSSVLEIEGESLWLVGLGDLWAQDLDPAKAFEDIGKYDTAIALSHNPESVKHLKDFHFDAIMCGHTHGVRTQLTRSFSRPILNRLNYHAGMYHIDGRKLYVNRGLGRLGKFLFNPRPEITVFNLC